MWWPFQCQRQLLPPPVQTPPGPVGPLESNQNQKSIIRTCSAAMTPASPLGRGRTLRCWVLTQLESVPRKLPFVGIIGEAFALLVHGHVLRVQDHGQVACLQISTIGLREREVCVCVYLCLCACVCLYVRVCEREREKRECV